ncbi:GNAT family N-acetyltransferase [Sphingomonas sp. GB1N7]|uniref:GNAT family N-acetyltransferase n=1 Tax=Parasphingomonas caseinilytica TaxID=3096158 RepID=UPI002FC9E2A3
MITTERLILRGWRDADVPLHNAMCNDAAFMQHLGPPLPMAESAAAAARQVANLANYGSCFWAVELRETGGFIGYCGIKPGPDGTPIAGLPEIGWGIAPDHWRRGLAREGASACLDWAWAHRDWPAVHAITVQGNVASWGAMERIGMTRVDDGDFDHPALAEGDPLRRHIHYRIDRPA